MGEKAEEGVYRFPEDMPDKALVNVRNGINRSKVRRLLSSKRFSYKQIAVEVGCTTRHLRRIRDELLAEGLLTENQAKKSMGIVAADFDEECISSTGESFKIYIQNKRKKWKPVFAFCQRTWKHVWGEPSIFLMMDRTDPTGAELCQKFIRTFGNNKKSIRDYKKYIRPFFVFIGRDDLKDKYMAMSATQDPEGVREMPQLEFVDFPLKLDKAISAFGEIYGVCDAALLKFKITSGLRTGEIKEERGWTGIKKKAGETSYESYLLFNDSPDSFVCSVFEKMSERWRISWIPTSIRHVLYQIYQDRGEGQPLVNVSADLFRKRWYEVSDEILGFRLQLHDFRKIFATWLIILGVPFNQAAKLNVGWADLNTLDKNYNQVKSAWKKSDIEAYRKNIPDWFKEDLMDYIPELKI